ncbi:MAG: hypothetical protein PF961_16495 [Planctomycetota bacterium]|jgi:hypothetical protein|nr:hypothetical protein [Planctomycetota bacterium]
MTWRWPLAMAVCWWPFMAVHELGHVLGTWICGGTVETVVLWPWTISQTIRSGSCAPLVDTWAGAVLGSLIPIAIWLLLKRTRFIWPVQFFAGFCAIANGLYLACGWPLAAGDAGELVTLGTPPWALITFGIPTALGGLLIWHLLPPATTQAD